MNRCASLPSLRRLLRERGFSDWDQPEKRGGSIEFARTEPLARVAASDELDAQEDAARAFSRSVFQELIDVALGHPET